MKTLFEIDKKISDITEKYESTPVGLPKTRQYKKDEKTVSFLRMCRRFIESNPSEDSLQRQKKEIDEKVKTLSSDDRFYTWYNADNERRKLEEPPARAKFKKEMGIDKMKKQLKTLQFLLG